MAVDLPNYDPLLDTAPLGDAELDTLDALLRALPGDRAMNTEGLDGYLSALLLGPRALAGRPTAQWMPLVWGSDTGRAGNTGNTGDSGDTGAGPAPFASQKQRKRAATLVLRHLHTIDQALQGPPEGWEPLFSIADTDTGEMVDAEDWCIGFLQAVALDEADWAALFDDPTLAQALAPLVLLGGDESALSAADRERLDDPTQRDALSRAVVDGVLALRARRVAPAAG